MGTRAGMVAGGRGIMTNILFFWLNNKLNQNAPSSFPYQFCYVKNWLTIYRNCTNYNLFIVIHTASWFGALKGYSKVENRK